MSETMRATRIHEWGGDLVLDVIPVPVPKDDQILIRVRASSINPVDWKAQAGYMQQYLSLPLTLGWEAAGDVVALGAGAAASGLKVGDAVYAKSNSNGFAEFVAVPAINAAPKPASLDYGQAATLPVAALTAWQGLFDHAGLQAGQKVLIHGAAGGVGHFGVQLAKWRGAYVIGTGSAGNEAFIRQVGADQFIDYRTTRFEDVVQDADVVFDTVGGETLERSYAAARSGGIVVTVAGRPSPEAAQARGVRAAGVGATATREQLDALTAAVEAGHIKPTVSAVYPLAQAGEALAKNKEGHTRGKMVITVP